MPRLSSQFRAFPAEGKLDLSNPQAQRLAAQNVANVYHSASPQMQQEGREWYPKVHDATAKGVRGTSLNTLQGAGLVAAVSPNMDWEKGNIDAFGELNSLTSSHWDAIHRSAAQARETKAAGGKGVRSPEAADVLRGLSISKAPDGNLIKAHRIMEGEDVDAVLNRRTAPKTNSFAHNIAEPDLSGAVTIDGRAHDIAANRLQGWTSDRGISSAGSSRGPTRYEHFENAYKNAAQATGELPHNMQAITWIRGKQLEMETPTKTGRPRVKGPTRVGQPYL